MKPTTKSFFEYLREFAETDGDKRLFFTENVNYTARMVFRTANAIALNLRAHGVKKGSVVALRCTRSIETALHLFALQILGALAVLTDPHDKVSDFLENVGVDITAEFIISNEGKSLSVDGYGGWELFFKNGKHVELEIPDPDKEYEIVHSEVDVRAPAIVVFTSGSTGKSKGVVLSQYNYLNHTLNYTPEASYTENDVAVENLPLHHVFGLAHIINPVIVKYELFFPKEINYKYITDCIEKYKITRLGGVPTYLQEMAGYVKNSGLQINSLRVGVIGGAPLTVEQFNYIEQALGLKLLPVYGMSECIGISGSGEYESQYNRASTVGRFLPMNEYFILDGNNCCVPKGESGEVCVKSPVVACGYYNDSEETKLLIDEQGRLHTGDLGFIDENGFLHISGRIKDIIIRNGNNLSTVEIERKILSLPQVKGVCVVGMPNKKDGEAPCALIVAETEADLTKALRKIELPVKIIYTDKIPLTSSGKPDKQIVKKMFEA